MRTFKNILMLVIGGLLLSLSVLYFGGYRYLFKAAKIVYGTGHKTVFLSDYQKFDNRIIEKGNYVEPWPYTSDFQQKAITSLEVLHKKYKTVAFIIFRNDSIFHEEYFDGYSSKSLSNSFSMAKTYVAALLGKAIGDGYIESLNQPVGDFFPEFSQGLAASLTVGDLASMASGLDWKESYYNPFSITTQAYFDENLPSLILKLKVTEKPGKAFQYLSGNTQLLAMVIEKATGQTLSEYLAQSIWKPTGAEQDAFWQLDSEKSGMEKAYCCIASNAKDFARLGKVYKDYGKWHNKQILDSSFVATSLRPRFKQSPEYGYGMWLLSHKNKKFFMMKGLLGQYVIVQPNDNVMIVRLGHLADEQNEEPFSEDIFLYIEQAYKMLNNAVQN